MNRDMLDTLRVAPVTLTGPTPGVLLSLPVSGRVHRRDLSVTRIPISKSLRFKIFTRDGYTCQYCGQKPPEVILHIDHRVPVSKGGDNDPMNLVTGCRDCNLGKAARMPGESGPTPDSRMERLRLTQERLEYEEYLEERAERDEAVSLAVNLLTQQWRAAASKQVPAGCDFYIPKPETIESWVKTAGVRVALEAMESMERHLATGWIKCTTSTSCNEAVKYFYGILRKMRQDGNPAGVGHHGTH